MIDLSKWRLVPSEADAAMLKAVAKVLTCEGHYKQTSKGVGLCNRAAIEAMLASAPGSDVVAAMVGVVDAAKKLRFAHIVDCWVSPEADITALKESLAKLDALSGDGG